MSVQKAQDELDFVTDFEERSKRLMDAVQQWEVLLINERNRGGRLDTAVVEAIEGHRHVYETERDALQAALVRCRELCTRYGVNASEDWLRLIPLGKLPAHNPDFRDCTFTPYLRNVVLKEIVTLRGAARDYRDSELAKAARPWYIKGGELLKMAFKWLDDRGVAKWFVIGFSVVLIAIAMKLSGFDQKGILEIVKLFIKAP